MKRIRTFGAAAAALGLAAALTACSGGGLLDAPKDDSAEGAGESYTVGVSYPTSNSPFWAAYMDFVEEGAEQLGVELNTVAANGDEQKQLADVQNLISQGVDGLIITPTSTAVASQLLQTAADADVEVVVTDRYPDFEPGTEGKPPYTAFIGPNDELAGENIARALIDAGSDKILALGGVPGSSVTEGRKAGLEKAIENGGTLVQYQAGDGEAQENGLSAFESLLQAHPSGTANGVWCYNDNLCQGAIKAAQNADRADEYRFGGMDLTPEAITAIEKGDYYVSFGGHWLQGGFGLVMLYDKLGGKDPKTPIVKLDLLEVNADNVAEFKEQYIDNPPEYDFTELSQITNPDATGSFEITLR
ncbi:substrate-binding domain-containing protein [Leucobacter luti]|uniref:Monosaccharide ABC transporter substrate-binding protein (CUT2 family) n=1 Tax=Leucobacter luti TaxID=340320 RepID=A0A4Q7U3X4_9MICO|nr:substrate-binding domain-containing protein [Leucobacter luti]MBL3700779.1 sugar ABC transporter substrate-binding protein [Leucobacter luti]RZT68384.1 monosaccharide ABC transporter substrate-binding protein (CUT2 family) [Leucobacter luti]